MNNRSLGPPGWPDMINRSIGPPGWNNTTCDLPPYRGTDNVHVKFYTMVLLNSTICVYGITGCFLALRVFLKPEMRCAQNTFLTALAVCDIGVQGGGMLLYSVEILYDYIRSYTLQRLWVTYLAPVFFLSHIAVTGAIAFTVAATVERWLALKYPSKATRVCSSNALVFWIVGLTVVVIGFNVTRFFETVVVENPGCSGMQRFGIRQSALAKNKVYSTFYSVWMCLLLLFILPFVILLLFNVIIAQHITMQDQMVIQQKRGTVMGIQGCFQAWEYRMIQRRAAARRRETSLILVVVVTLFLVCNLPDLVLTLMEHFDLGFLRRHPNFYSFSKDAVNLLTIVNSASNFTAYVIFGKEFRKYLKKVIKECFLLRLFRQRLKKRVAAQPRRECNEAVNHTPEIVPLTSANHYSQNQPDDKTTNGAATVIWLDFYLDSAPSTIV